MTRQKIKQKMCAKSVKFDFGKFGFIFVYSQVRSVILLKFAENFKNTKTLIQKIPRFIYYLIVYVFFIGIAFVYFYAAGFV